MNRIYQIIKSVLVTSSKPTTDTNKTRYSPYLQLMKPLLDVSKAANLTNEAKYGLVTCLRQGDLLKLKLKYGLYSCEEDFDNDIDMQKICINRLNELQEIYTDKQKHHINTISKLPRKIISALKIKGYKVRLVESNILLVRYSNQKAVVQIADDQNLDAFVDLSWNEIALENLNKLKARHDCQAAIYVTPSTTQKEMRIAEKKSDVFVLSGWDVVQLLAETNIDSHGIAA